MEFCVVQTVGYLGDFTKDVQKKLNDNWTLVGGLSTAIIQQGDHETIVYSQSMIKE